MGERYLLTGALGCIGAWVTKLLVERGDEPWVFDLPQEPLRLRDVMDDGDLSRVQFVTGDVTDLDAVTRTLEQSGARRVIHLAGLQVPFCKADPARGARVNVLGTVNLFQAARQVAGARVVYASSAAVYGPDAGDGPLDETVPCEPTTHYGVYKRANEGTARIFWQDDGVSSVGLRPLTVYGVGRDQGLTSDPTRAMKAAVLGRPFEIRFSGSTDYQYVSDTAATFIRSADSDLPGAHVWNLHGDSVSVPEIVAHVEHELPEAKGTITVKGPSLPIPPLMDGSALVAALPELPHTPLDDGIRETIQRFAALRDAGRLRTNDLDA